MRLAPLALLLTAALLLSGCPDYKKMAEEDLTSKGMSDVELTQRSGAGHSWDFTGTEDGIPCTGVVTVSAMTGSSAATISVDKTCKDPNANKEEEPPPEPLAGEKKACSGGDLDACTRLGVALVDGDIEARDPVKAREVHELACDGGKQLSCAHLGRLWARGLGGEQNEDTARALYELSCSADEMLGCAFLGRLHYINRKGKDARKFLKKACDGGSYVGCDGLGAVLKEGIGGKPDVKKAKALFDAACQGGEMSGCANLGVMYMKGEGGVKNPERAREHLKKACAAGVPTACQYLKRL